jgi:hypothetical protein
MSTEPETTEEDRHLGQLRALEQLAHTDGSLDATAADNAFDYDPEETAEFTGDATAFHDDRSCDEQDTQFDFDAWEQEMNTSSVHGNTAEHNNDMDLDGIFAQRSAQLLNEFASPETVLPNTFPHIFLLGKDYSRKSATLTKAQHLHLLLQFTNVAATNRRFLGYGYDATTRHEVIHGVNAHCKSNRRSIQLVNDWIEKWRKNPAILKSAIADPASKVAKKILRDIIPNLQFASCNNAYSYFQSHQVRPRITEGAKTHDGWTAFITLSFDDISNPRSFCTSFHTITNDDFPSQFSATSLEGATGMEFMERMRHNSAEVASANIPAAALGRDARSRAAMNNPIAYVLESKAMVVDFLTLLLGQAPEDFYGQSESTSQRRTYYFRLPKGLFGHSQDYILVVEDHGKGTLHYHLVWAGGLNSHGQQQ